MISLADDNLSASIGLTGLPTFSFSSFTAFNPFEATIFAILPKSLVIL